MAENDDMWFEPQRYGYGAGVPIAWQGWAVLGLYILALAAAAFTLHYSLAGFVAIALLATAALFVIGAAKTRGGWHWRWGED